MNKLQEELTAKLGIQLPSPDSNAGHACRRCKKREPDDATQGQKFKRCSRCRDAYYCSPECQSADWKRYHKLQCAVERLATNIYLETVPTQEKAMDRLIDAYRMRVEDDCMYNGKIRGLYDGDPLPDFRSFLDLAERRAGVLPRWWNQDMRKICEARALDRKNWSCIAYAVEKSDIQEYYKDSMMPMQLRMLAEQVYGRGVM